MRIAWAVAALVALSIEAWLLVGRRSGEAGYRPAAAVIAPSPEIAGALDLTQTFVSGADGLAAVTFTPMRGASAPAGSRADMGPIDLELRAETSDAVMTMATRRLRPDELVDGTPFTWDVPRVENAAGRRFVLRIAAPEAAPGRGLRVAIGPPDYRWGALRAGGRAQWGDLVFETRATRVHVLDVLHQWQRQTPGVLGSDAALVGILVVLNLAAGLVIWYVAVPRSA